jgi:hypothetical protein
MTMPAGMPLRVLLDSTERRDVQLAEAAVLKLEERTKL